MSCLLSSAEHVAEVSLAYARPWTCSGRLFEFFLALKFMHVDATIRCIDIMQVFREAPGILGIR